MADANASTDALSLDATHSSEAQGPLGDYGETMANLTRKAKDFLEDAAGQVKEKVAALKDIDFAELSDSAKKSVARNPGKALLISAGVGLVIGVILRGIRN